MGKWKKGLIIILILFFCMKILAISSSSGLPSGVCALTRWRISGEIVCYTFFCFLSLHPSLPVFAPPPYPPPPFFSFFPTLPSPSISLPKLHLPMFLFWRKISPTAGFLFYNRSTWLVFLYLHIYVCVLHALTSGEKINENRCRSSSSRGKAARQMAAWPCLGRVTCRRCRRLVGFWRRRCASCCY